MPFSNRTPSYVGSFDAEFCVDYENRFQNPILFHGKAIFRKNINCNAFGALTPFKGRMSYLCFTSVVLKWSARESHVMHYSGWLDRTCLKVTLIVHWQNKRNVRHVS